MQFRVRFVNIAPRFPFFGLSSRNVSSIDRFCVYYHACCRPAQNYAINVEEYAKPFVRAGFNLGCVRSTPAGRAPPFFARISTASSRTCPLWRTDYATLFGEASIAGWPRRHRWSCRAPKPGASRRGSRVRRTVWNLLVVPCRGFLSTAMLWGYAPAGGHFNVSLTHAPRMSSRLLVFVHCVRVVEDDDNRCLERVDPASGPRHARGRVLAPSQVGR